MNIVNKYEHKEELEKILKEKYDKIIELNERYKDEKHKHSQDKIEKIKDIIFKEAVKNLVKLEYDLCSKTSLFTFSKNVFKLLEKKKRIE